MKSAVVVIAIFLLAFSSRAKPAETNAADAQNLPARQMLGIGGIVTTAPERKASPPFTGKELPLPPKQHASWTIPKNDLPTNHVSATELLFQQGMADPRGCDYREMEIGTGEVWQGDGGVVKVHGWVLPGRSAEKFAVCWNGMVYPVVSTGTNADLEVDVAMLVTNRMTSWRSALPEALTASEKWSDGIKGCFLLRLGRADLAERLWLAQELGAVNFQNELQRQFSKTNRIASTNEIKLSVADPYLDWASDWAWMMFDRMICAHERGDEKLALFTARQLASAQPQIEAACAARGIKQPQYPTPDWRSKPGPYLGFLEQFPEILADLERRDKEGAHVSILTTGITNITDQSERIAALIHDLDLAAARQWGQPGWVNPSEDAIVGALIAEDDVAVEPLLDCLEHDKRLTRSVGFGRDFQRSRTVISVGSCADVALKSILQANFSSAAEMRAYWDKYKNLEIEDRWFAILQDDSARARWQEAANNIVQPENITHFPGGLTVTRPAPTNAPVRLRGEPLRARSNPSVTELLSRRALEHPSDDDASYDLSACCQFAECLAKWDPPAALEVAGTLSQRAALTMKYSGAQLGEHLTQLALIRARNGDPHAFDEYAVWIASTVPGKLGFSLPECLEPMLKFPTNEDLQAAALKLFTDTNSPWAHLPWKENNNFNPLDSGLVKNPAFRLLLVRELENTNVCGTISWHEPSQISYAISNYQNGSYGAIVFPSGSQPANGTTVDLRWGDWIAFQLSNGKSIPFFNPFAPVAGRDKLIAAAKDRLLQK
jgi:hypothetical protein